MASVAPLLLTLGLLAQSNPEEEKQASGTIAAYKAAVKTAVTDPAKADAVRILGQFVHRRTMALLCALAADPGQPVPVRTTAADLLGTFRGIPGASKTLMAVALEDDKKTTEARRAACRALGELRAGDALGALHALAAGKPYDVAKEAVTALGKVRHRNSIPFLIELLKDVEPSGASKETNPLGDVPGGQVSGGDKFGKLSKVMKLAGMASKGGSGQEEAERRQMIQEPIRKTLQSLTGEKWSTSKEWVIWWAKNQATFGVKR